MDYKLEYISRLFQKTSKKALENYVLTRLWHKLDNYNIKMVPQQYVNRNPDKYALTDVYFPQFGIHVEVNEPAHYDSPERILADKIRKSQIESQTGHKVYEIDCRNNLSKIHMDVDLIIDKINASLKTQKDQGEFRPWLMNEERNPLYWKEKNVITTDDDICFNSIEDICELFDADFKKTKRGWQRIGGIKHPKDNNIVLWWPSEKKREKWHNVFDENKSTITEFNDDRNIINNYFQSRNISEKRYVFFNGKDILGLKGYRFIGIFSYNEKESKVSPGIVWGKIGNKITLNPNSFI
ncbi:MAG: AbaSI family restriction endonuclease [Bacteroidales bacterium]|jgi:hypothetical protein